MKIPSARSSAAPLDDGLALRNRRHGAHRSTQNGRRQDTDQRDAREVLHASEVRPRHDAAQVSLAAPKARAATDSTAPRLAMTSVLVWALMRLDWAVTAASNSPRKAARSLCSEASNR